MSSSSSVAPPSLDGASAAQSSSSSSSQHIFLGLDSSTQSFKITAVDERKRILQQVSVVFESECPEFATQAGIVRGNYGFGQIAGAAAGGGEVITSPSLMFVAALERALAKLVATGLQMHKVRAISVSGQQHGSVYWRTGAAAKLAALKGDEPLATQLRDAFSVPNGPIWMDSSTHAQCRSLESAVGGAQSLATLTGSSAYERFTGNQIAKIASELPDAYAATERISLVSSMIPSILLGKYAPIDASDAAGMNLMDINAAALPFEWSAQCLDACVPGGGEDLRAKLGRISDSAALLGPIHPYFASRFGLPGSCEIVPGSGDNPCSLVGLGLSAVGDLGVSLGTSDTLLALVPTSETRPRAELGHVFPAPLDVLRTRMLMLCFKNGSLARERVRDQALGTGAGGAAASSTWKAFNEALASTPPGNAGQLFFAFCENEIVPHTRATGYFSSPPPPAASSAAVSVQRSAASGPENLASQLGAPAIRGVLESQFLNMLLQARRLGMANPRKIIATGGASNNLPLLQVLADTLGADVYGHTLRDVATGQAGGQVSDTASLGAAYRALQAVSQRDTYAQSAVEHVSPTPAAAASSEAGSLEGASSPVSAPNARQVELTKLVSFRPDVHAMYDALMPRFEAVQAECVRQLNQ